MIRRLISLIFMIAFVVWGMDYANKNFHIVANQNSVQIVRDAASADNSNISPDGLVPVEKVVDGDTIEVNIGGTVEKVRLIGVNTPETVDPRKPVECFGKEASNFTKSNLEGKSVRLESDDSQSDRDKYDRLLRYVFLSDGTNFNLKLVKDGYAYEYTYRDPYKYQQEFKAAQAEAQKSNLGLWSPDTCNGVK